MVHHGDVEVRCGRAAAVVGPHHVGRGWPQLGRRTPNGAVARLEGKAGGQAADEGPRGEFTRTGDDGFQRQVDTEGVVGEGEVRRRVGNGGQLVDDGDVEVGHGRATAVVGPHHVGGLRPQLGRRTVNGSIVCAERKTRGQGAVDGPVENHATRVCLTVDLGWLVGKHGAVFPDQQKAFGGNQRVPARDRTATRVPLVDVVNKPRRFVGAAVGPEPVFG